MELTLPNTSITLKILQDMLAESLQPRSSATINTPNPCDVTPEVRQVLQARAALAAEEA